jgi:hypothetical protein
MNDERKARALLKELKHSYKNNGNAVYDGWETINRDAEDIKEKLAELPHIPNKKEGKIIRRLKQKSGIKSTEEIYKQFGKQIAEELKGEE